GVRELHPAVRSPEERLAQLPLERRQPGREGRLRDVEDLRGAAEVALAGDLEEAFDLSEEHARFSHPKCGPPKYKSCRCRTSYHSIGLMPCPMSGSKPRRGAPPRSA